MFRAGFYTRRNRTPGSLIRKSAFSRPNQVLNWDILQTYLLFGELMKNKSETGFRQLSMVVMAWAGFYSPPGRFFR